jgi:hypothetical protein
MQKEKLKEQIDALNTVEHTQIFSILCKYTKDYTRTDTGVFVSLDTLSSECIDEISKYIDYCKDQKTFMDEYSKRRLKYEAMLKQ